MSLRQRQTESRKSGEHEDENSHWGVSWPPLKGTGGPGRECRAELVDILLVVDEWMFAVQVSQQKDAATPRQTEDTLSEILPDRLNDLNLLLCLNSVSASFEGPDL